MLTVAIGGTLVDYNRKKEAELTKIRQEQQQLLEEKNLLEKQKVELEETKKQLEKKLEAKAQLRTNVQVRVASANSGACVDAMKKVFPEHLWSVGAAIMRAESGARPNAIGGPNRNGTYDYGCWQINDTKRALDPDTGTKIAWYKYQHSGWQPWTVYKTGAYRRFL